MFLCFKTILKNQKLIKLNLKVFFVFFWKLKNFIKLNLNVFFVYIFLKIKKKI